MCIAHLDGHYGRQNEALYQKDKRTTLFPSSVGENGWCTGQRMHTVALKWTCCRASGEGALKGTKCAGPGRS